MPSLSLSRFSLPLILTWHRFAADKLGKDVWIENTTSVYGFHRRVCVSRWVGSFDKKPVAKYTCCEKGKWKVKSGKYCISFGVIDESDGGSSGSNDGGSSDSDSSGDSSVSGDEQIGLPIAPVPFPPGMDGPDPEGGGIVYVDLEDRATKVSSETKTSCCQEDIAIAAYFKSLVNLRASYNICGQNCRDFSASVHTYSIQNFKDQCK